MAQSSLRRKIFKGFLWLCLLVIVSALGAGYYFVKPIIDNLPDVHTLQNAEHQIPLKIYSHDKLLIARFGEKKRTLIKFDEIPPQLINAFLAAEDDRFYEHPGVDYQGLLRAALQLITTGKKSQGGSTITMQVTRNFLLSSEKTFTRKIKEIFLAFKIEAAFSKREILELYLNKIYFGQHSYGINAAAETYFGKPLHDLNLAEFALLAGLPKAPSLYNPTTDPDRAMQRRNYVLKRMLELKHITTEEYDNAMQTVITPPKSLEPEDPIELEAPYIAEMARQTVVEKYGEEAAYSQGLTVYTTITKLMQTNATKALRLTLHQYDQRHGYRIPAKQANYSQDLTQYQAIGDTYPAQIKAYSASAITAVTQDQGTITIPWDNIKWASRIKSASTAAIAKILNINDIIRIRKLPSGNWALCQVPLVEGAFVALNPKTGAIIALEGGFDFYNSKYNRATQSKRQPGSGFKPIIYTTALENGFTPSSMVMDSPVVINDPTLKNGWRPENFGHRFYGPTSLRDGLKKSRNIVSVKLLMATGIKKAAATAMRFGFDSEDIPRSYSMALGSGQASPLQMARMYSVFANDGAIVKPYFIERIVAHDGKVLFEAKPSKPKYILTPAVSYMMNSMLRDVVQSGTATRAKSLGRSDIAGKTGTTNDGKDVWFNGYTDSIAATAWLGFDNPTPLGNNETGGDAALPMWMSFMREALKGTPQKALVVPKGGLPKGTFESFKPIKTGQERIKTSGKEGIWEFFDRQSNPVKGAPKTADKPKPAKEMKQKIENLF
ncbi:MAG: penicillin-binding protein 1A [Methylococcaceae bacterium]|nr:penicillin-binding protein 1A [Methylococcaceae bacterium]